MIVLEYHDLAPAEKQAINFICQRKNYEDIIPFEIPNEATACAASIYHRLSDMGWLDNEKRGNGIAFWPSTKATEVLYEIADHSKEK